MKHLKNSTSVLILVTALFLSACTATGTSPKSAMRDSKVEGAMAVAAKDAASNGKIEDSLAINEKLYRNDPNNQDYILAYARDLRHLGRVADARLVIRTPAMDAKATSPMMTEAAMVLIANGDYKEADEFADKAIAKDATFADAYHAKGLALSGLNKHQEAQAQFEKALTIWPTRRDKTAIINNLAMSQAAQGDIKAANETMAMATGEALMSEIYQNNRALLSSLKDTPQNTANAGEPDTGQAPRAPKLSEAEPEMPAVKMVDVTEGPVTTVTPMLSVVPVKKPAIDKTAEKAEEPAKPEIHASINPHKMAPILGASEIAATEPAASADMPNIHGPNTQVSEAVANGPAPTQLFEAGYSPPFAEPKHYKSVTGFIPQDDVSKRRFGLNN